MAINIREIFTSDLDPNSQDWWSKDKLDKINLNFKQFIQGGPAGPQGHQGVYGGSGPAGSQGPVGPQGYDGHQGTIGETGEERWIEAINSIHNNSIIFPKITTSTNQTHAISLRLGEPFGTPNTWYNQSISNSAITHASTISNMQTGFNQITMIAEADFGNSGSYKYIVDNSDPLKPVNVLKVGALDSSDPFELSSISRIFKYITTENNVQNDSLTYDNYITLHKKSEYPKADTKDLIYEKDAGENKILVPIGTDGKLVWKNKTEVFGTFPVGTILSISYDEYFNDNNFYLNENVSHTAGDNLNMRWGRGRETSQYSGWYICNGRTWGKDGIISYTVPNLNRFYYSISGDGSTNGQQAASISQPNMVIIGGYDFELNCQYDSGTQEYTNSLVNLNVVDETFESNLGNRGDADAVLKRNVNIVYLGNDDFEWNTVQQTPATLYDITLTQPQSSADDACSSAHDQQYKISTPSSGWSSFSETGSGVYLYNSNGTLLANSGWYETQGISRYWNGNSFIDSEECGSDTMLYYSDNVKGLNGFNSFMLLTLAATFKINSQSFSTATTLKNTNGINADAGWYRLRGELVQGNTNIWELEERRYWDGEEFVGETITDNWILIYKDTAYFGASRVKIGTSSQNLCNGIQTTTALYYAVENGFLPLIVTNVGDLNGLKVYVHTNLEKSLYVDQRGEYPLTSLYNQNGVDRLTKIGDEVPGGQYRNVDSGSIVQNTGGSCI